jgi:hypothetical protein
MTPPLQDIALLHDKHESAKKRMNNAISRYFRSAPRVTLSASVEAPGGLGGREGEIDDLMPVTVYT